MEKDKGLLTEKLDPKQQAQADIFVINGINIIYNQETSKNMVAQLGNSQDPVEDIANITLRVVNTLETAAKKNKIKIDEGVLVGGANVLMGEIVALAEASGMEPFSDEQKQQAFALATSKYINYAVESG